MTSCDPSVSGELNILLVGPRRTGKSSTGNTLLGKGQVFDTNGGGASAVASAITNGRQLTIVDAKGWGLSEEDFGLRKEKIELLNALKLFGLGGPHVILLVIPLLDFTEQEKKVVEKRMEVLTPWVWKHTILLFTCGDLLRGRGQSAKERIHSGGPALQWLMEKCCYRYQVFSNKTSSVHEQGKEAGRCSRGEQEQVGELLSKVEDLLDENGGWNFSLHMYYRIEEEWCRREQSLRAQLQVQTNTGGVRRNLTMAEINMEQRSETNEKQEGGCFSKEQERKERKRNGEREEEERRRRELSSEEDMCDTSSDSGGEKEEGDDVKTGLVAPFYSSGGLKFAYSSIRSRRLS